MLDTLLKHAVIEIALHVIHSNLSYGFTKMENIVPQRCRYLVVRSENGEYTVRNAIIMEMALGENVSIFRIYRDANSPPIAFASRDQLVHWH